MDHHRLGRLEAFAGTEQPGELEGIYPDGEPRPAQAVDLGLREEIAGIDEVEGEDLARVLVRARAYQGEEGIVLVARGAASALDGEEAGRERIADDAPLAGPISGEVEGFEIGIGKVEAGARGAKEREGPRPSVVKPDRSGHRVEPREDRVREQDLEPDKFVREGDLEGIGLVVRLDVGGGKPRKSGLTG